MSIVNSKTGTGKNNQMPASVNPNSYNVVIVTTADTRK